MDRSKYTLAVLFIMMLLFPLGSIQAQETLPQVPITYPGDTDENIDRRAEWIQKAKEEKTVVWWGTTKPREASAIIAEFNKIYPFITVNYWAGGGDEIGTRVEAEALSGHPTSDICLGGGPINYPRWRKAGVLEKFFDIVPTSGKKMLDKRMYSEYGDWVMPSFGPKVPQYNTNLVPIGEAPKNWDDLLHPKWKGQIGMNADVKYWWTLALAEGGWGLEKTEDFLNKLKQQGIIWGRGLSQSHTLLIAGEFKILGVGNLRHVILSQERGAPVEWTKVNPVILTGAAYTFQAKSPHPNAARLLIEWLLSSKGLQVWANVTAQYVPGTNTLTDKVMKGLSVVCRTEKVILTANELGLDEKFSKILGIIK